MRKSMENMLEEYRKAIAEVFGNHEVRIILYGSYARGDFHVDSDVDIMVLADMTPEDISYYTNKLYDVTYDFEMKYGVEINPVVQSKTTYERWKNAYPFFMNIEKEGVVV